MDLGEEKERWKKAGKKKKKKEEGKVAKKVQVLWT